MLPEPIRPLNSIPDDAPPQIGGAPSCENAALAALVRAGDEAAFEQLFRQYYNRLCVFVTGYVGDRALAEELVETVFARIWQQRSRWEVQGNLTSYLYAAARYQVLDFRRHAAVERRVREHALREGRSPGQGRVADQHAECEASELDAAIRDAIEHLPERCRLIFNLRWQHHLSYAEIAETLGIASKTVETQINRALKVLRARLQQYW